MASPRIVITAPLTEIIDHAGYFIQMSLASLPIWLEGIIDRKYPTWRQLEWNDDGSARYMPAGARVLEASLLRRYPASDVVCCYPDDVDKFIGPETRIVAISTHNPIGVTFAAGVYASIFGSAKQPINSHYARKMFARVKANAHRARSRSSSVDRADGRLRRRISGTSSAWTASSKAAASQPTRSICSTRRWPAKPSPADRRAPSEGSRRHHLP
jgi:hypothetical protein